MNIRLRDIVVLCGILVVTLVEHNLWFALLSGICAGTWLYEMDKRKG